MKKLVIPIKMLVILAMGSQALTSCVSLRPPDREFRAVAEHPYMGGDEELIPDADATPVAKEPVFQSIKCGAPLDKSLLSRPTGPYRIGPGDILDIEVAENKDTRTKSTVMPDGMLYFNTARGVNVKGKTVREISTLLSHQLKEDYVNPVVTVNVSKADSQRFWMLGQVAKPGTYPITKPTTLVDAISTGSGLLSVRDSVNVNNPESADLERAAIIRGGEVLPVNFDSLIREGDMSQNIYVNAGDYIFIPSLTASSIYVLGHVNNPGPISYERDLTMLAAVAGAGGPKPEAVVTKALIIRGGHHNPEVAVVNFRDIMKGFDSDLKLQAGDIIWMPRSNWSNVIKYTGAVLNTAAQAIAVQEGLSVLGATGSAGISINAGG
ncbi:polysaccharide biosynthesis/export family protein [Verrucomicrobiales bacterium BCK34]|nr:polysaccharide biosynthesis/export family protein [Verrucomicrobiales bacterium BCK34]